MLTVERQFVAAGDASYWALCVSLAPPPGPLPEAVKGGGTRRVDYREVLDEADFAVFAVFAVFARLRVCAAAKSKAPGAPVGAGSRPRRQPPGLPPAFPWPLAAPR